MLFRSPARRGSCRAATVGAGEAGEGVPLQPRGRVLLVGRAARFACSPHRLLRRPLPRQAGEGKFNLNTARRERRAVWLGRRVPVNRSAEASRMVVIEQPREVEEVQIPLIRFIVLGKAPGEDPHVDAA